MAILREFALVFLFLCVLALLVAWCGDRLYSCVQAVRRRDKRDYSRFTCYSTEEKIQLDYMFFGFQCAPI